MGWPCTYMDTCPTSKKETACMMNGRVGETKTHFIDRESCASVFKLLQCVVVRNTRHKGGGGRHAVVALECYVNCNLKLFKGGGLNKRYRYDGEKTPLIFVEL